MLTSKTANKPSRILPGDEYGHFGGQGIAAPKSPTKSGKKSKKKRKGSKSSRTSTPIQDLGFSYGFDASSGLSSTGELVNPFGDTVSDYDIDVSWAALSNLAADKRVTIDSFLLWINHHLQLNWDDSRIKRAWAALDQDKLKYITFKEFKSGLKSTNSDVITFYSNLMQRTDVHPIKGDKSDWESLKASGRIKRMREFSPRYLRGFSRNKKGKEEKTLADFQAFLTKWRKFSVDFLHNEYWKPLAEGNKNYVGIVGNLWQKMCNMMGIITSQYGGSDSKYSIITYEFFIMLSRLCSHQPFVAYFGHKHMTMTFIQNLNTYDLNDSNCQGKIAWVEGAMISMIKYANRPTMSLSIANYMVELLLVKLGAVKQPDVNSKSAKASEGDKELNSMKAPKVWNECCKRTFIECLCIAIDCTESVKPIRDMKGKEGGLTLIKKLSGVCLAIFGRTENSAFQSILEGGYKLLSRVDVMDSTEHDKVLKKMASDQRKRYNRNFGQARIIRFTASGGAGGGSKQSKQQSGSMSKIKPGYGASSPIAPQNQQYTQKYRIGQLGATVAMNKIKKGMGSAKSRIIDVSDYKKLQNPFEFKIQEEDIVAAFRYADVNQDNAISFTDFTQSLMKVGVIKDDEDAKEMWCILNPSMSNRGVNLDKFRVKLEAYPKELHNWLCRITSCNHLARQPFKTDPNAKSIKKILKDQRKLTWKERIDALHAVARLFARTNDSKKEFQNKFKSFLPRLIEHLKDPHALVVRASCVALTKIMIYKNGSMTKYTVKIMEALTPNFKKADNRLVTESCFGCFANLVRHVPDNKKFATLTHIHKLVTFKNVSIRCFGWRIAAITFERILGLKKARPNSWWVIVEDILKAGRNEKSKVVQCEAIRLLFIFQNSTKHYHYVEKYIQHFTVPNNMEHIKANIVADIQERMDEYAEEAAAQADAMDVYSLISTEQEFEMKQKEENAEQAAATSSVGAPSGDGRFDFVDDIMDGKPDPLANRGLGTRLILHRINRDDETIRKVYELYDIGQQIENTRTLLASLKYLGINIGRGELTLIVSEIKMMTLSGDTHDRSSFTVDKFAFFVKHCFATLDVAWSTYLKQVAMDIDDADIVNIENPKQEFDSKMNILRSLCVDNKENENNNNLKKKCDLLSHIYNLFVTPQVENDDVLFEEMMEALNPIILTQIKENLHCTIWCQEICILICRIAQFHISRFAEYGAAYYEIFFQIMAYSSNIVAHCCAKTCLVIASMVSFLNEPTANEMTTALIGCTQSSAFDASQDTTKYWQYQEIIYKCLLAECLVNVPLTHDDQIRTQVIDKLWSCMKTAIYHAIANSTEEARSVRNIALNILAYMHSAQYLNLAAREEKELNSDGWRQVQQKQEEKEWNLILRQDIEANETAPFNNLAMEHGWDNLQYYSQDFNDRNQLMEQWYELEQKANNPIGMAAVTQLIKALNHMQYKAMKTQTKPKDWDPNANAAAAAAAAAKKVTAPPTNNEAPPIAFNDTTQTKTKEKEKEKEDNSVFSSLTAQYLAQQRQQNQSSRMVQ